MEEAVEVEVEVVVVVVVVVEVVVVAERKEPSNVRLRKNRTPKLFL